MTVRSTEQREGVEHWGMSFVFGGQQYDHFGDSGKEVIVGRSAPEKCSAAWALLWDRGKPRNH